MPLFTENPRVTIPGNRTSAIGASRKLNIFYYSCLKALHIGSLTSRISELRRTRNLIVTVLQYVDVTISLLPLLGPESPLLQSPVLFLLPDARGYRLTELPRRAIPGNRASCIGDSRKVGFRGPLVTDLPFTRDTRYSRRNRRSAGEGGRKEEKHVCLPT